jgi:polysaccharide export outer membrane protein
MNLNAGLWRGIALVALTVTCAVAQTTPPGAPTPVRSEPIGTAPQNYLLSPNDVVNIKVFQEDDLLTTTRVANDGTIVFPLLGTVRIGGQSIEQATAKIRDLLEQDYLVQPQVTITVTQFAKRRFSVLGEVNKPGTYELPEDKAMNLLQAISMAGGYTRLGNPGKITVRRQAGGKEQTFTVDAKSMARDNSRIFEILPEDTITVPESIF